MDSKKVAKIVGIMFASRDFAHRAHLKTPDYSKHMALNSFYLEIIELADDLAEVGQGMFGLMSIPTVTFKSDVSDPIKGLTAQMNAVLEEADGCSVGALKNIVDEIQALYLKTLYKMKYLS